MSSLTQVRQQLETALDELKRECVALQIQIDFKRKRLEALEFLLVGERAEDMVPQAVPDGEDNATKAAKEIIRLAGATGLRPRDITRKLREQGFDVNSQFASNVVWKLKNKTQEIEQHGTRYFWKSVQPTGTLSLPIRPVTAEATGNAG